MKKILFINGLDEKVIHKIDTQKYYTSLYHDRVFRNQHNGFENTLELCSSFSLSLSFLGSIFYPFPFSKNFPHGVDILH